MVKEIVYYYTLDGKCPYIEWLDSLDFSIQSRVLKRHERIIDGLYGDHKPLQNSPLSELRFDFGKGYRIYYYDLDDKVVLFVAGGDKQDQKKIVKKANEYFAEYMERAKNDIN